MKPEIVDTFRKVDINGVPYIKQSIKEAKEDTLSRNQVIALEIAWRRKMVSEGKSCSCGRKDMLTTDHLIPKMLLYDFGVDVERTWMPENLVLLCRPCNSMKSGHLDFSNPHTKIILQKLLERL